MALSEAEELELLELEEQEAQQGAPKLVADSQGLAPRDASGHATGTPEQQIEFERTGMVPGASEPEEMRALRHINELGAGAGAADLATGVVRGGLGLAANSGKVASVRTQLAGWFEKQSAEQAAKAGGAGSSAAKELGAEGVRDYGRMLQDKGIVAPYRSSEESEQIVSGLKDVAGKGIGDARALASSRGTPPSPETIKAQIGAELESKYASGLHAGESGSYTNALDELTKQNPKDFTELSGVATDMNSYARTQNKLMQPTGATTDVANVIARESDAGVNSLLDPAEAAGYKVAKEDWGDLSMAENLMSGKTAKGFANSSSLPVSKFGAASRIINAVAPHSAFMGLNKTIENALRTNPASLGQYAKVLQDAVKRGGTALASTTFVLQQQDPQFQAKVKELENGKQ